MAFDYSSSFSGINNALANLGKQNDIRWLREAQADVGQSLQGGDFNAAAQKAFGYGDHTTGLGLLKLGQEKQQEADWLKNNGAIFGGSSPGGLAAVSQPQGYFATTANAESGNDPNAKNPKSSATGTFQFTEGTWRDLAAKNPQLGLTPDGRTDPAQQQRAMQAFTSQNAQILQSQGIPANDANLYMTHFLGAKGGPAFIKGLQSNPNAPASAYVDPKSVAANRSVFFNPDGTERSAGEVYTAMTRRFGGGSTAVAQLQGGQAPAPTGSGTAPQGGGTYANVTAERLQAFLNNPRVPENLKGLMRQELASRGDQGATAPVQVAENEADVRRLETQQGSPAVTNPAPVQVAQAPAQPGSPVSDIPAQGAAEAQFFVPGSDTPVPQSIANDPRVINLQRALAGAPEKYKASIQARLSSVIDDLKAQRAENAPTGDQKNYQAALRGGYKGSFFDYQSDLKRAGANPKGEDAYDTTLGKANAEYFVETQKGGRDASGQLTTLKRMQSLINDPEFYSGWNGGRATAFKKLAVSLGIKDAEAASANELFDKLSKQAVLDKAGGSFGTGFSNGDREYIDATTANIDNTPEGNRRIIEAGIKVAQRKIEVSRMAREYAKKNGGRLDAGFDDEVAAYAEKNPLFADQTAPKKSTGPAKISSPGEYERLKSGDQFLDPDGNLRTKR